MPKKAEHVFCTWLDRVLHNSCVCPLFVRSTDHNELSEMIEVGWKLVE